MKFEKVILGLKNSKSSGMDEIDTFIIKLGLDEILQAATHIVDLSFEAKEFTSIWKVSKVIPLPLRFTLVLSHFPTSSNSAKPSIPECVTSSEPRYESYPKVCHQLNQTSQI